MNKAQREAVNAAWLAVDRATDYSLASPRMLWSELNAKTLEHEKKHRAIGRRFTDGRAGYKESALLTAKFFAVRAVLKPYRTRGLNELIEAHTNNGFIYQADAVWNAVLIDLASTRSDVIMGAMLRACLEQDYTRDNNLNVRTQLDKLETFSEVITSIDYSTDIAVKAA